MFCCLVLLKMWGQAGNGQRSCSKSKISKPEKVFVYPWSRIIPHVPVMLFRNH